MSGLAGYKILLFVHGNSQNLQIKYLYYFISNCSKIQNSIDNVSVSWFIKLRNTFKSINTIYFIYG